MKKVIGIVSEGPTDYMVLKEVIDHITGIENEYRRLQPEPDMAGRFGNGWKGVWKWCESTSEILDQFFYKIIPQLDLLVIQMDADVSRKEKEVHCQCKSELCELSGRVHPLTCKKIADNQCNVKIPCEEHGQNAEGYEKHLEALIRKWLGDHQSREDILITIPCDSTDAWIVAAYQEQKYVEMINNPWENVIARKKEYHGVRVPGSKKRTSVYSQFLPRVCHEWNLVAEQCYSARSFERKIKKAFE